MQGLIEMITLYGPTLNCDQFRSPFDEVVEELVEKRRLLHESFREHMQPQWKHRLLDIIIVDNPDLNAYAAYHDDRNRIYIFRGVLESIYGNILGLLSTPAFLST